MAIMAWAVTNLEMASSTESIFFISRSHEFVIETACSWMTKSIERLWIGNLDHTNLSNILCCVEAKRHRLWVKMNAILFPR